MTEEQKKELFIATCLTEKDLSVLSEPMNTNHTRLFDVFKIGLELSES